MSKYRGDLVIPEAWDILKQQPDACLIDVRTSEELIFTGAPWLDEINKELIHIPWRFFPNMELNTSFGETIQQNIPNSALILLFICRSGGRSREAAMYTTKLGYENCYNIVNGFEGEPDNNHHRGTLMSWKAYGLPWRQA